MGFGDHLSRMDAAIVAHLSDGVGVYHSGSSGIPDVPYILDRNYEIYDENQLAKVVTTISIPPELIGKSLSGDRFVAEGRDWRVHQVLEDDGHWRRLYVS